MSARFDCRVIGKVVLYYTADQVPSVRGTLAAPTVEIGFGDGRSSGCTSAQAESLSRRKHRAACFLRRRELQQAQWNWQIIVDCLHPTTHKIRFVPECCSTRVS